MHLTLPSNPYGYFQTNPSKWHTLAQLQAAWPEHANLVAKTFPRTARWEASFMARSSTELWSWVRALILWPWVSPAAAESFAELGFCLEIWFSFHSEISIDCHELAASKFTVIGFGGQDLSLSFYLLNSKGGSWLQYFIAIWPLH